MRDRNSVSPWSEVRPSRFQKSAKEGGRGRRKK